MIFMYKKSFSEIMADEVARPMKYPYTYTAKVAQFPYKFYFTHSWGFKYGVYAFILCAPIFYKIQKLCKYFFLHILSIEKR